MKWGLLILLVGSVARADPDLALHHAPMPHHLRMRTAQPAPPAPTPLGDDDAVPAPIRARTEQAADRGIAPSDPAAAVRFRMDLGFGVDGAQDSHDPTLAGHPLSQVPYDSTRGYGFGDLYLGTHGLVMPSLSTYLAAHAQLYADSAFPPLVTPYDRSTADQVQVRSGWAETDGLFQDKYLQPIRIRAGRQYIYGPAPAHMDGLVVGYETKIVRAHFFGGTRVPDWDLTQGSRDSITGADLRLDLAAWKHFPAVIDASTFHWGAHDDSELGASVTRGKGLFLRGSVRTIDGNLAHENVTAHFRVSDTTRITATVDHRSSYDWRWDPEWVTATDAEAARRYLDLGAVGPRYLASVRAGTVLYDNVDVLVRGAGAFDQVRTGIEDSTFAATWGEVGGALEVRARRTLALGLSTTYRTFRRELVANNDNDLPLTGLTTTFPTVITGAPLPPSAADGEQSFVEGGTSARYSTGARRLSAEVELYARRIRWHRLYDVYVGGPLSMPEAVKSLVAETRGGGRFSLEAWVTPRVRLRAEYELSTGLDLAPEVLGYKSLRLIVEGTL